MLLYMKQAKVILEFRYKDIPQVFTYRQKILSALTDEPVTAQPTINDAINLQVQQQHAVVQVEPHRTVISIEQAGNKATEEFLCSTYDRIDRIMHFDRVEQLGYRTIFYEESDEEFEDMVERYKSAFFKEQPLVNDATDISVPLTYETEGFRVNFQTGPMTGDEFKLRLDFEDIDVGNLYYVDIDHIKRDLKVSARILKQHMHEVRSMQDAIVNKWKNSMEGSDE